MFVRFNSLALKKAADGGVPHGNMFIELSENVKEIPGEPQIGIFDFILEDEKDEKEPAGEQREDGEIGEGKEEADDPDDDVKEVAAEIQMAAPIEEPKDPTVKFIVDYIAKNGITAGFRWMEHRMSALEQAGAAAGLKDTGEVLKRKIMARVKNSE